ncbi:MAG: cytochrome c3 family protein [Desulfobulbaceae bacterium]|nr:cytochrome c3 family protein [Desulfobulbaceae bacterium]
MKNHVLRPLWVTIIFVALILLARYILVPKDFGVHGESFTYNYYRAGNAQEWKDFPVSYQGKEVCVECHTEKGDKLGSSPHAVLQCENCHGPGKDHPETENPETMSIDRSRALCLRCHADLGYAGINRASIPGIDANQHNVDSECIECHDSHNPDLEEM